MGNGVPSWEHCYVITQWLPSEATEKIKVSGRAEANRITRRKLAKGFRVAWSVALIERMTHR